MRRRRIKTTKEIIRRKKKSALKFEIKESSVKEICAVLYGVIAVVGFLSTQGSAGPFGFKFNEYMVAAFGRGVWIFPILMAIMSFSLFLSRKVRIHFTKFMGMVLALTSILGLIHLQTPVFEQMKNLEYYGGYVGFVSAFLLRELFGDVAAPVILIGALLVSVIIIFEISLGSIIQIFRPRKIFEVTTRMLPKNDKNSERGSMKIVKPSLPLTEDSQAMFRTKKIQKGMLKKKEETVEELASQPEKVSLISALQAQKISSAGNQNFKNWELPELGLLDSSSLKLQINEKELVRNANIIKEKLSQFGLEVSMRDINVGPTVTQYTLRPNEGIKLTKITALKSDIALALAAKSTRIEAPIPGKSLVGIEIPNKQRMVVHLREMIDNEVFKSIDSNLRLPIGRDVSGKPIIDDLVRMPHLLIAGRTGAGKSVCMNSFLISLLYQNSPAELKFIMVDPKRVELMPYNGIPHLLTSVITDVEKSMSALRWTVGEMSRRYALLSDKRYRNVVEFNKGEDDKLCNIVIVIDELADLMMQGNKREAEALICRIAQMARAVGIHLIIATQRPSVDVITGLIKANIPSRISFAVVSGIDSRTIIDTVGSEDLLGLGDMLYLPGSIDGLVRIQGILVSRKEIERVARKIKIQGAKSNFAGDNILAEDEESETLGQVLVNDRIDPDGFDDASDDKFFEAVEVVRKSEKASATMLQRYLSIGYARAAKILDAMEERGLIGETRGAKPRAVYMDKIEEIMANAE